ncbi:Acetyltransferase (GNAT) domain-containing protein [Modestobacter sp. DSM 44400]|uniref:GNAT family N-acetyltransferase n=1 Tax=Modestobacter sp. DSM 44400 TaxID=1550230 RepID=UPI000894B5FF|nr:GNAT family N-acetyltransferase [Modestobacter sp. DSM 44400]SDX71977.1 Acetyltransferase (GNAT) domain-containing protein [Modestobacter sp. DSM 44400]
MTVRSGASLRWYTAPGEVAGPLRQALTVCWRDVANAGGAVGFAELLPVTDDDVAPAVDGVVAALDPRLGRLLVAERDGALAGWLVLTGNANPVLAHWGRVTRVQTALAARGTGVARALMTEVHRAAHDLGLELLRLEVRGGMGLEDFYARFGWTVAGPVARGAAGHPGRPARRGADVPRSPPLTPSAVTRGG